MERDPKTAIVIFTSWGEPFYYSIFTTYKYVVVLASRLTHASRGFADIKIRDTFCSSYRIPAHKPRVMKQF